MVGLSDLKGLLQSKWYYDSMKYSTFSSAIPCLPRECSYWVEEGVHLGTDLRAFSSPSAIFTGTACGCPSTGAAGLEPPAWFLALREDHIKHKWPHHMGPLLCESMLWCTSLTLPCLHLAVPAPCASPHSKNTRQQFVFQSVAGWPGDTNPAGVCWVLRVLECPPLPSCQPSHYEDQYYCFNFKFTSDVPRNWPLLMAM